MTRSELINRLIVKNNYKSYLEIGVNTKSQPGYNWDNIKCNIKHGVDPNVDTDYRMSSDDFFWQNTNYYDIIFIDGLHLFEQVTKDINHSLSILNDGGCIVVHDCNPPTQATQTRERKTDAWHGDVWKAIYLLRIREDIKIETVDTDEGCCIIRKGSSDPYQFFDRNRKELLNLISVEEWLKK